MNHYRLPFLAFLSLSILSASAYDFEEGGIYFNISSETEQTCEVVAPPSGTDVTTVVIPASVDHLSKSYTVTAVNENAYYNSGKLSSVILPSSVTKLGANSFALCPCLFKVMILSASAPEGIATAFDSIAGRQTYVPSFAYSPFASVLGKLNIYQPLKWFEDNGIRYIVLSSADSVCDIFDCAELPATSLEIGESVEYDAKTYRIENINDYAFYGKTSLLSLKSANTGKIGKSAFASCTSLHYALLSDAIEAKAKAFSRCASLDSIFLGRNFKQLGDSMLYGCPAIKKIISASDIPPLCTNNPFTGIYKKGCTLSIPSVASGMYKAASQWAGFSKQDTLYVNDFKLLFAGTNGIRLSILFSDNPVVILSNKSHELTVKTDKYSWAFSDIDHISLTPVYSTTASPITQITQAKTNGNIVIAEGTILVENAGTQQVRVYSSGGLLLKSGSARSNNTAEINISDLEEGIYILRIGKQSMKFFIKK